jgi:hypothetical protein
MAVALVLWSSTLTTAKFSPRVPHLLETGENFGLSHFLILHPCFVAMILYLRITKLDVLLLG